jgi:glycosyl transferase family 11
MVSCKLYGRLGNQMFQIAASIAYGLRHEMPFVIQSNTASGSTYPHYFMDRFPKEENDFFSTGEWFHYYHEPDHQYIPIPKYDHIFLDGYFQSEKYFADYREDVLDAFHFDWLPIYNTVSVHVRRGDYLQYPDKHPCVSLGYLRTAIDYFRGRGLKMFLIFSDDVRWVKENLTPSTLGMQDVKLYYVADNGIFSRNELTELEAMSGCEHHIIANSSFSWWGAWLNRKPDKIVIAPDPWFGPGNAHLDTRDLLPAHWIKMPI